VFFSGNKWIVNEVYKQAVVAIFKMVSWYACVGTYYTTTNLVITMV